MAMEIGNIIIDLNWITYLCIGLVIFHIMMLIKAAFRRQWGWFFAMIAFPLVDIFYLFK